MFEDYPIFADETLTKEFKELWFFQEDLQLSYDSEDDLLSWKKIGTEHKDKNIPYSDSFSRN